MTDATDDTEAGVDTDESATEAFDPADLDPTRPVLLFDGVCNLCSGLVTFVVPRDPAARIRFASLQSTVGRRILDRFGVSAREMDSVALVEGDRCYTRSAAVLRLAKHLGLPYSLLYPLGHLPRDLRDAAYDLVASNRYELFGRRDRCLMPPPDAERRFLDRDEDPDPVAPGRD